MSRRRRLDLAGVGSAPRRPARRTRGRRRARGDRPCRACRRRRAARRGAPCGRDASPAEPVSEHGRERAPARRADGRRGAPTPGLGAPVGPGRRSRRNARARRQRADQALRPARLGSPPPLRVVPRRRMGARHTRHLGPRLELRRRRGTLCVRRRAVPACAGAPVPGAAGRLRRGAALAGRGSRAAGHRPVPNCRGRHERRGQSRRGGRTCEPRGREPRAPLSGPRLSRAALRLGHANRCAATSRPSTGATSNGAGRTTSRTRTTARTPWPRRSSPTLHGLPPALIVTAEHDPLRDEGELYAEKLRQSGVDVDVVRIAGAAHGFFSGTEERTTSAQRLVAAALGRAFEGAQG